VSYNLIHCSMCNEKIAEDSNPAYELYDKRVCWRCYDDNWEKANVGMMIEVFGLKKDPNLEQKITDIVQRWDDINEQYEIKDWRDTKKALVKMLVEGLK